MKLSIIIPAYNCQDTIERCLNSILNQKYKGISEIIVVDDGSEDNTYQIALHCAEDDSRIHCISKDNGGVSSARNVGIDNAHGKYIMFIDSDDEMKEELAGRLAASAADCQLVVGGIELHQDKGISVITDEGNYLAFEVISRYGMQIPGLLLNGPCCKLYNREIIENNHIRFDPAISLGEDTLFVFEYLKYCNRVVFIDYAGYIYYQLGTDSLMTKYREDAYSNAKNVYRRIFGIVKVICKGAVPENIKLVYKNVLMGYIRKMIFHHEKVSKEEIRTAIKDYVADDIVQGCISQASGTIVSKVFDKLTVKKKCFCLEMLLRLHVMLRGV